MGQAGVACEDSATFTKVSVVDWTGNTLRGFSVPGPTPAYLSPDGRRVALYSFEGSGVTKFEGTTLTLNMQTCGWIDSTHVIAGDSGQAQARIGDVTTGKIVPVAARGTCAGRLPGGL